MGHERITLSVEEGAELLGISRSLAYELVRRGDLPGVRLGRRIVIPTQALLARLQSGEGPAPD